jgi:hypothetical protein
LSSTKLEAAAQCFKSVYSTLNVNFLYYENCIVALRQIFSMQEIAFCIVQFSSKAIDIE